MELAVTDIDRSTGNALARPASNPRKQEGKMATRLKLDYRSMDDVTLARHVADRDREAVRLVTERNNQRLFRAAWSIVRDRAEAEDVVQSAYLRAFAAIAQFEGRSSLSTWLTRIAINEALERMRAARRRRARIDDPSILFLDEYRERLMRGSLAGSEPDAELARAEIRRLLEREVAKLPAAFRTVFVLRDVEGLSVEETAAALNLVPATVKTRLLRARRRLREALAPAIGGAVHGAIPFAGARCSVMTDRILTEWCG